MSKDNTADRPEADSDQRERPLGEQQTGSNVQLLSDKGKDMNSDTDVVIEDGGGVNSGKETVHPSPTNVDASRMPSASVFIKAVTEDQS